MKTLILLIFILPVNSLALVEQEAFELIENQTFINDEVIHGQVQKEIVNDEFSEETYLLIQKNEEMKNDIDKMYVAEESMVDCPEDGKDKKKKRVKRKKKNKEKIKHDGEWVIGAMFEMNQVGNQEEYSQLESPMPNTAYEAMYNDWLKVESYDELMDLIKEQTQGMDDMAVISYISEMTGRLPYNDDKASFKQGGDIQKPDSLWSMIQEQKKAYAGEAGFGNDDEWGGVCGDIHFAALMMGEIARPDAFEYFTASYVVGESQHVYMFAIDKNTGKAVVVNYDEVQVVENPNGAESIAVKNDNWKGGFNNVGTNLRIFANSSGDAKHVATIKSALGSFLYQASTMDHERIGTPMYEDFQTEEVYVTKTDNVTKKKVTEIYDKEGNLIKVKDKQKSYTVTNGVKLLHGTRNNGDANDTDIWTLAYFRRKATNTDGFGNVKDPSKFGKESNITVSGTKASLGNMFVDENVYVLQVNYTYGLYKTILRTDKVDLQANGRVNINGDFYMMDGFDGYDDAGNPTFATNSPSGDGNLETSIGVSANINPSDKDKIKTYVSYDQAIGVKRERNLYEWSALPNNVQLTSNAVRAGLSYQRYLAPDRSIAMSTNYTGTQVGGLFNVTTAYNQGKHHVFVNYQNNAPGINKNIQSNLLPNAGQRITTGYGTNLNFGQTNLDLGANVTYLPDSKDFFVGGRVKMNINTGKKKKKIPFN